MKLIKYDKRINRLRADESDKPLLHIQPLKITLYKRLIDVLEIQAGDGLSLFQSEDNEHDWYIAKDPDGLPLCQYKGAKSNNRLEIANRKLGRKLCDLYGEGTLIEVNKGEIEHDGLKLHLLITAPIVAERRLANLTKPKANG